jgi:predicted nucleotidyltransferase
MKIMKEIVFNKNPLLILSYLSKSKSHENISAHIAKDLELGSGSVHQILKQFEEIGIVQSRLLGKSLVYETDRNSPLVKSFRIFENMLELDLLFNNLKIHCRKIILFGSCATGEDSESSDIDIFIVADIDEKDNIINLISDFQLEREIKPVIVDTVELMEMEKNDKVFLSEIMKGIEVWEGNYGIN